MSSNATSGSTLPLEQEYRGIRFYTTERLIDSHGQRGSYVTIRQDPSDLSTLSGVFRRMSPGVPAAVRQHDHRDKNPFGNETFPWSGPDTFVTGSASFAPDSISGLQVWYKADSLSLNNGDPVSSWTDSSTNANHATQVTAGNKPLFWSSKINSLPAVNFIGGNNTWLSSSADVTLGSFSLCMVIQDEGAHVGSYAKYITTHNPWGTPTDGFYVWGATNCSAFVRRSSVDIGINDVAGWLSGSTAHTVFIIWNGTAVSLYRDNVLLSTTACNSTGTPTGNAVARLVVGGNPSSPGNMFSGSMGEYMVYNKAISSTERSDLQNHLRGKWGTV